MARNLKEILHELVHHVGIPEGLKPELHDDVEALNQYGKTNAKTEEKDSDKDA